LRIVGLHVQRNALFAGAFLALSFELEARDEAGNNSLQH
jgi:hypothetical protein